MSLSLHSLLVAGAYFISSANALNANLVGTWSTKSAKVFTGPGFYNPVNDSFIEPSLTGISYSFTSDGFYEEAYYRAVSDPTNPACPQAIMQWQHGTVVENSDGSLSLSPISVDGRQLQSDPCSSSTSTYTRYNQSETMKSYTVSTDAYTKLTRLDLYEFDGSPMNPMFLAYSPPQMLPTITLNPTSATASATAKVKRSTGEEELYSIPMNANAQHIKRTTPNSNPIDLSMVWWTGAGMCVFGAVAYLL